MSILKIGNYALGCLYLAVWLSPVFAAPDPVARVLFGFVLLGVCACLVHDGWEAQVRLEPMQPMVSWNPFAATVRVILAIMFMMATAIAIAGTTGFDTGDTHVLADWAFAGGTLLVLVFTFAPAAWFWATGPNKFPPKRARVS